MGGAEGARWSRLDITWFNLSISFAEGKAPGSDFAEDSCLRLTCLADSLTEVDIPTNNR